MKYYNLKSIVAAQKTPFEIQSPSESFNVAEKREAPYIEPSFEKVEFDIEKPAVILISAVGVTGKSTLAQVLSHETGLPLFDLAKHKPVGDNTLTGLLTSTFRVKDLSGIFEGIGKGGYGVIIDGIDEGRSKTTEKAFEAFLDDIVHLCKCPANTNFVLLGRTQIIEDCSSLICSLRKSLIVRKFGISSPAITLNVSRSSQACIILRELKIPRQ